MLGLVRSAAVALAVLVAAPAAMAAQSEISLPEVDWSFDGFFGTYDKAQLQRGLQVFREVCSACHALDLVAFRNLSALGYSEAQVKALAAEYQVTDGPNDAGDMFQRPGIPADHFPAPFANEKAARAANGGAYPPNLSLIAKAREGGPTYVHALLNGYRDAPADVQMTEGMYYNLYFPGHQIAMAPPLSDGQVTYADGTRASVDQMGKDVSAFLMWAAEPHLEQRKQMGMKVLLFLLVFTGLMYAAKRRVWRDLH